MSPTKVTRRCDSMRRYIIHFAFSLSMTRSEHFFACDEKPIIVRLYSLKHEGFDFHFLLQFLAKHISRYLGTDITRNRFKLDVKLLKIPLNKRANVLLELIQLLDKFTNTPHKPLKTVHVRVAHVEYLKSLIPEVYATKCR